MSSTPKRKAQNEQIASSQAAELRPNRLRRAMIYVRWGLLLVVGGALGIYLHRNWSDFAAGLALLDWSYFAAMGLLSVANNGLSGLRWYVVARRQNAAIGPLACVRMFFTGRLLGLIFPQGGSLYRLARLRSEFGMNLRQGLGVLAVFTWLTVLISLLGATGVLFVVEQRIILLGLDGRVLLSGLLLACGAVPLAGKVLEKSFAQPTQNAVAAKLVRMVRALNQLLLSPKLFTEFLILSLANFLLTLALFYLAFLNLQLRPGLGPLILLVALMRVGTIIVLTPGNLGVLELVAGYVILAGGFSMEDGILVMLELRVVSTAVVLVFGGLFGGSHLRELFGQKKKSLSPAQNSKATKQRGTG
jgi:uncharacterized membrane protein YbhN (UPF0104 family)